MKVLVAVDGSKCALSAVRGLIRQVVWYRTKPRVDLVNVQLPVPRVRGMSIVVSRKQIERYYRDEGAAALSKARKLLDAAGIPHVDHILVGQPAESIVSFSARRKSDLILIGARGRTNLGNLLVGSVATGVLRRSGKPVQLVR